MWSGPKDGLNPVRVIALAGVLLSLATSVRANTHTAIASWNPTTPLFLSPYGGGAQDTWTGHAAVLKELGGRPPTVFVLGGGPNTFNAFADGMGDPAQAPPQAYSSVYQANIDGNGVLQTWAADPAVGQLPVASILHTSTVAMNDQIYVIGGVNSMNAAIWAGAASRSNPAFTSWSKPDWWYIGEASVFFENAPTGSSLGNFEPTAPIPILDPTGTTYLPIYQPLIRATSVTYQDTIYVLGGISRGNDDGAGNTAQPPFDPLNPGGSHPIYEQRIWYCKPEADGITTVGNAGSWQSTTPLPLPLYDLAACIAYGRIYIIGGRTAPVAGTPTAGVHWAAINPDGTLGTWHSTEPIPGARAEHGVVFSDGAIYVLGGVDDGGQESRTVFRAVPNPATGSIPASGQPGAWSGDDALLPAAVAGHAVVASSTGRLYVLGGRYTTPHSSNAYVSAFPSPTVTQTPDPTATPMVDLGGHEVLAFPNPAKGDVGFTWQAEGVERVRILIYNLAGERIAELDLEGPGRSARWRTSGIAPGIYFYRVTLTVQGQERPLPAGKLALLGQ
jgi:hypothetical protein